MKVLLFPLVAIFLLTACAQVPTFSKDIDADVKNMTPPPGKALVYLYRTYQPAGNAGKHRIHIDGAAAGQLVSATFMAWPLEPGTHHLTAESVGNPAALSITVQAGETYYIEEKTGWNGPLMASVSKERGRADVDGCRLAIHEGFEQKPATVATTSGAAPAVQPSIKSDIDELPTARGRSNKNAYAIVVGIEQYRQDLPKADYATQDAQLVATYLARVLGFPEENIVHMTNEHATKSDFEKYFEKWLPNNVEPGSTVLVYYSGHGAPNPRTGDAYLVPYDGDPTFIEETGYSLRRLYAALGKLPAKEVIVALDSCFSGAGGHSVIAKGARPLVMNLKTDFALAKNIAILSASSGEQISSTYQEKGHGLFTYFLLKGIKNEDVVKQDGSLDVAGLYDYVKPQVTSIARKKYNNEQTPQLIAPKTN